jgi:hypothetical protein
MLHLSASALATLTEAVGVLSVVVLCARLAWGAVGPEVNARFPRVGHTINLLGALCLDLLPAVKALWAALVGTPWPSQFATLDTRTTVAPAAPTKSGVQAGRRSMLATLLLLPVAGVLARCAGSPIPAGNSDAGSAFVIAARVILGNLATWLSEIGGNAPAPVVLAAVQAAQAAVVVAQQALNTYAATGGSVCAVVQASVTAAVNAAVAVIGAVQSINDTVPTLYLVAVESAGTIVDAVVSAACSTSSHRVYAVDRVTGRGGYVLPLLAALPRPMPYMALDPSAVCPAP